VPNQLEEQFHQAMLEIHRRAKTEADYNATRFIGMVADRGGLATARYLLHASKVSEGYAALWERGRLDLTVEAEVLKEKWQELFSPDERQIAAERLRDYGYAD
jgi:hypothetical protein